MKRTGMSFLKTSATLVVLGAIAYGTLWGWRFWQTNPNVRVSSVVFEGDIPPELSASFAVKPGAHLFRLDLKKLEGDLLKQYVELEKLNISRGLDRSIRVSGRFKKAAALYQFEGKIMGVNPDGMLFPIHDYNPPDEGLVILTGKTGATQRAAQISAIHTWKDAAPTFIPLVKKIETDNIGVVRVILDGGIVIEWGEMVDSELVVHAENVLNILERFSPAHTPATLHVLSKNRVVMDSNWKQK
jgi:hypothetical protein